MSDKEIIEKIEEYVQREIDIYNDDINKYIYDNSIENAFIKYNLEEDREHWKDILKIIQEKQQINNTNNEDKELKQEAVTKKDETYKNSEKIKSKKVIKGKLISLIILLIMIPVLAFSTYKIVNYLIETPKTKNLIKEINCNLIEKVSIIKNH